MDDRGRVARMIVRHYGEVPRGHRGAELHCDGCNAPFPEYYVYTVGDFPSHCVCEDCANQLDEGEEE